MRNTRFIQFIFLALAVAIFVLIGRFLPQLAQQRTTAQLTSRETLAGVPPAYALADGLLGGFRGFLISSLWMRAQEKKQKGQYYEMVDIYRIITTLEPNYPASWANMAWDLSYNVAAEFEEDPNERLFWVFRGIHMLRDQAIRNNPRAPRLYYELSWIFYNKSTNSVDPAFPLYRRYLATQVSRVLLGPGHREELQMIIDANNKYASEKVFLDQPPVKAFEQELKKYDFSLLRDAIRITALKPKELDELLSNKTNLDILNEAKLIAMYKGLRDNFNMDPQVMLALNERFGDIDWRLPQAHSLYWAWLGQKFKLIEDPNYTNLRYERIVYFSLIQLAHKGTGIITKDGFVIAPPNPEMLDKTIDYIDDLIQRQGQKGVATGVKAGFENFLRVTVFNYYFEDDKINAERMRLRLIKFSNEPNKWGKNLSQFMQEQLPDFIDGMMPDRAMMLLVSFCNRAYWYLANGRLDKYNEQMKWFDGNYIKLYKEWLSRFQGTFNWKQQIGMPTADELRIRLAANIFSGNTYFDKKQQETFKAGLKKVLPKIYEAAQAALDAQNQNLIRKEPVSANEVVKDAKESKEENKK